jgi:Type I phosphodiesterase / nucleotide pyrophosphatase
MTAPISGSSTDVADPPFVLPAYGSGSLADLVPSIAARLGLPGTADVLGLPDASKVVLLLVDGLGAESLAAADPALAPCLAELVRSSPTLTTGFPSTTSTSITSLATGLPPGTHGVMGYQFRVEGHGLLNALSWPSSLDPLTVQRQPNQLAALAASGVSVSHVGPRAYTSSGLTRAAMAGTTYTGADSPGEKVGAAMAALRVPGRVLVNVYTGELDNTGHLHGVDSDAWRAQLGHVDRLVEQLLGALPADGLLLVTGDHGMVDATAAATVDVENDADLAAGVELLGGEPRARHVYAEPGAAADALAAWRERLAGVAWVRSRWEAVAEGWFGEVDPAVADRIGDVVAACHSPGSILLAGRTNPHEALLVGHHGSLTTTEALVPLLIARGGA